MRIKNFKVQNQIFLASAVILLMLTAVIAVYQKTVKSIESDFSGVISNELQMESLARQIDVSLLEARRAEKDFLLRKDKDRFLPLVEKNLGLLEQAVTGLLELEKNNNHGDDIDRLSQLVEFAKEYKIALKAVVASHELKGLDHDSGLQGQFRKAAHSINENMEDYGIGLGDFSEVNAMYLTIRKHEKDYLLRGDDNYVKKTRQAVAALKGYNKESKAPQRSMEKLQEDLSAYLDSFNALVEENQKIARDMKRLRAAAHNIEPLVLEIIKEAEVDAQNRIHIISKSAAVSDKIAIGIGVAAFCIGIFVSLFIAKTITDPLGQITDVSSRMAKGDMDLDIKINREDEIGKMAVSFQKMIKTQRQVTDFADQVGNGDYDIVIHPRSDKDRLSIALGNMTAKLKEMNEINQRQIWLTTGLGELVEKIRSEMDLGRLGEIVCQYLAEKLGAGIASFYLLGNDEKLQLHGDYAFYLRKDLADTIRLGQGLVGQAARSGKLISITEVPEDYIRINSSLGNSLPTDIVVCPFLHEGSVKGVIELASHKEFTNDHLTLLKNCMETIGIAVNAAQVHVRMNELLEETQRNNEELQVQQEELQVANEELEEKTKFLQESETELQSQQEELRVTNEELEEKNKFMADKQDEIRQKNIDLEDIKSHLEFKARELEISGKYKSEFLANMSHELRTPLNSLLILAQDLKNNNEGNLTDVQVESAGVIYKGGNDLLKLINEILDLSKIEAGKMTVNRDNVPFVEIAKNLTDQFNHIAQEKGLAFETHLHQDLPPAMMTDAQRLEQILRNLCSNAIKFTRKGRVDVEIKMAGKEYDTMVAGKEFAVLFEVKDTGIGISKDKQHEIFEAFQQVDGSISREYGGTGLGLSISRELATLLGGVIMLDSQPGKGTSFKLYLPLSLEKDSPETDQVTEKKSETLSVEPGYDSDLPESEHNVQIQVPSIKDDREEIKENDRVILVIEDDLDFAATLKKFCAQRGFKFLHAGDGFPGLILAEQFRPQGIILDLKLPQMSGWDVLNSLKKNMKTRHIPVHIMSGEDSTDEAVNKGAIGFLNKPATIEGLDNAFKKIESVFSKKVKELLVVEDDETLRTSIARMIGDSSVNTTLAATGAAALESLQNNDYDCMILDLSLPDMSGYQVLEKIGDLKKTGNPPVIIYTGKELSREQEFKLKKVASSIILKTAYSTERLLDETALFLHKVTSDLPGSQQRKLVPKNFQEEFKDRQILLVDDDMRNLFAISKVLQDKGFCVHQAPDGEKALKMLKKEDSIELIVMDIMMPVMDGIEATGLIRKMDGYKKIPIIALTAKAMPDDRHKCIKAGASDYITKPVDINNLLSMIRIWL